MAKLTVLQALPSVIELPHSPLIKYTATDLEDNSAAFGEAVAYKKLDYKVSSMTHAPLFSHPLLDLLADLADPWHRCLPLCLHLSRLFLSQLFLQSSMSMAEVQDHHSQSQSG